MTIDIQAGGPPAGDASQSALAFLNDDRPDEAVRCYQHLLQQKPADEEALCNLASAFRAQARLDEAIDCCRGALAHHPASAQLHDNLFTLHFSPKYTAADILEEARRWNDQHAAPLARFIQPHWNDRSENRRLHRRRSASPCQRRR